MSQILYENIKRLADEKKLSITQVEEKSNIGNGTIGKWKAGHNNATLNSLSAVANALECSVSDLLKETN